MPPNVVAKETAPRITVTPRVEPVAPKTETAPPIGAAATPPATTRMHVVRKGDTYTSLAIKYLGDAKYYKLIAKANPGREANRLYIGSKLNIPAAVTSSTPAVAANAKSGDTSAADKKADAATRNRPSTKAKEVIPPPDPSRAYVVQQGDNWQSIARKFLGKSECDAELYELNKERIGGDPNLLRSGLVIELPARAKMTVRTAPPTATLAKPAKPASSAK
jgi:nucleoid-associated protein YgaU